ncbi:hypothetical protein GQ44DRAFT_775997 [Phaeosphaeriaceae sp. PMI808]|nr:hypothetical protein GQ44DRAFT_775997 [Phaeosphaeriaceae sp. PMI808]
MLKDVNSYTSGEVLHSCQSPQLGLAHPTANELITIWRSTAFAWKDALSLPVYLEESQVMTTVPLARYSGMTNWILVNENLAPDARPILSSCESFRKLALISDGNGNVVEGTVHGITSVFCPVDYRGRSYPRRMMWELAKAGSQIIQTHLELNAVSGRKSLLVTDVRMVDLPALCQRNEARLRGLMTKHLAKEDFTCRNLFGKAPQVKGAITGSPGSQVWAIWAHRYYDHPDAERTCNILYILRFVIEIDKTAYPLPPEPAKMLNDMVLEEQMQHLKVVLQAAQIEAFEWKLNAIHLWDLTPLVREILPYIGIEYKVLQRDEESIASGLWYGKQGDISKSTPPWLNNEYYAWC